MRSLAMALVIVTGLAWVSAQTTSAQTTATGAKPSGQTPATTSSAPNTDGAQSSQPSADLSQPSLVPVVRQMTVPAGTEVLLQLKNAIDTKNSHTGDGVYCQTTFPIVIDNITVIPPGTYVKGEIAKVQRAGRMKGRAEVLLHFNTVIFPSGYTVDMPGTLHGDPGTGHAKTDEEGAVKSDGHDKLKKAPEAAGKGAEYGALGGAIASGSLNGARIGGGIGAAVGLASVLLTRGPDVRIEPGASLTMRLERPLVVDVMPSASVQAGTQLVPRPTENKLAVPVSSNPK